MNSKYKKKKKILINWKKQFFSHAKKKKELNSSISKVIKFKTIKIADFKALLKRLLLAITACRNVSLVVVTHYRRICELFVR